MISTSKSRAQVLPSQIADTGYDGTPSAPEPDELPGSQALSIADRVAIKSLLGNDSPRLNGEDADHIELLANSQMPLPPILVHRQTMRVIDGMHRVAAALMRGEEFISVVYFDGTEQDAFLKAVAANVLHGLPLTRADREAAAARIVVSHPDYSDRRIAASVGLAPQTITAIRSRMNVDYQTQARIGKDGRVRPVNSEYGRRLARDALIAHPEASLREIARIAHVSPGTVRDVRRRMTIGEDPVSVGRRASAASCSPAPRWEECNKSVVAKTVQRLAIRDRLRSCAMLLEKLAGDPSLRASQAGRALLQNLHSSATGPGDCVDLIAVVPPHSLFLIAELARSCADGWMKLAEDAEHRLNKDG